MVETPTSWLHAFSIGDEKRNSRLAPKALTSEASTRDLEVVLDLPEPVELVPRGLTVRGGRGGCGCTASTRLRRRCRTSRRLKDVGGSRVDFRVAVRDSEGMMNEFGEIPFLIRNSLLQVG